VYRLAARLQDLAGCRSYTGAPVVAWSDPAHGLSVGGIPAVAATVSFALTVTRYGFRVGPGGVPGFSVLSTSTTTVAATVATPSGPGSFAGGATAVSLWSTASGGVGGGAMPMFLNLMFTRKETCTVHQCTNGSTVVAGWAGAPGPFTCNCGNSTHGCPSEASFARMVLGLQVVIPGGDPGAGGAEARDLGIRDDVPLTTPSLGSPYAVASAPGLTAVTHATVPSGLHNSPDLNVFTLTVATACRSEFDPVTGTNSRAAFASDPGCPNCFDVGVSLFRAPAAAPNGTWAATLAAGTDPDAGAAAATPAGNFTLRVRATLIGPVAPTTLVGEAAPTGRAALRPPTAYDPLPADPEPGSVPPSDPDALLGDAVYVIALQDEEPAEGLTLTLMSLTACVLEPTSPYLACLLGADPTSAALPPHLNGSLAAAPPQVTCPAPGLAGNCDPAAWAAADLPPNDGPGPVVAAVDLVAAYLPVASRGMDLQHLCRTGAWGPGVAVDTAGAPEFLCPGWGTGPSNASVAAVGVNCGSIGSTHPDMASWVGLDHPMRGTSFMDAVSVPRSALPRGTVALLFTGTVADCASGGVGHVTNPAPGRRLTAVNAHRLRSGVATPVRRAGHRALQLDPSPSPSPSPSVSPDTLPATVHTVTTVLVVVERDDDNSGGSSILHPATGVVLGVALGSAALAALALGCCPMMVCGVCRRRRRNRSADKDGVRAMETATATAADLGKNGRQGFRSDRPPRGRSTTPAAAAVNNRSQYRPVQIRQSGVRFNEVRPSNIANSIYSRK
jgi:hypothetical protein